jgi:HK97 family phage prohead protease
MQLLAGTMTRDLTQNIPALHLRAAVSPGSVNPEKRTAEVVFTTGAKVRRGFFEKFYEVLSLDPAHVRMGRLNNGAPLLDTHRGMMGAGVASVLGVVENARIESGKGIATVRFAKAEDDSEADKVFRKVKDGILQNVSVGYRVHRFERIEDETEKIPTLRATDWEPYEISVVPAGEDDGAGFRGAKDEKDQDLNPCVFVTQEKRAMAEPTKPETTPKPSPTGESLSRVEEATRAAAAARVKDAEARAASEARAREEERTAERERMVEIRNLVRMTKLGDELADKFVKDGTPLEEVRKVILEHLAASGDAIPTTQHVRIGAGEDERDKFVRGASAWLFESSGVRDLIAEAAKKYPERFRDVALDPGEFRGLKLYELARRSLERRGVKTGGMSQMEMVGMAFTYRANYQTIGDFPVLLETTMNKTLLAAYALQVDTWSRFCRAETLADFRASTRYRTGSLTVLDIVPEHGEFKNKAIPDGQKTPVSLQTYGNIVALSRQTIINDDLGALTDMAVKLGRAAKLTIESAVYTMINLNSGLGPTQTDAQPFFHANRFNVNATGSALTAAGIDADRVVMGAQKDVNNVDYIDLRPAVLLVPAGLAATARVLNGAPFDPLANMLQKPNPVQGLFRDVVDTPRLSSTRRYLLADPAIAPIIVVAFLEGLGQAPMVDAENGWRIDGVEWKVRLDAKAQMFDPKGGVTYAGA